MRERRRGTQTRAEKVAALKTILPILYLYQDLIRRVKTTLNMWESVPSPLDEPPRAVIPQPECSWRCQVCDKDEQRTCRRDERWLHKQRALERSHRLDAITEAYVKLEKAEPLLARAVFHEYIEPYPAWDRRFRERWASRGCEWMADHIVGDIPPFTPPGPKRLPVASRLEDVRERFDRGWSRKRIAKALHMSERDVGELVRQLLGERRT